MDLDADLIHISTRQAFGLGCTALYYHPNGDPGEEDPRDDSDETPWTRQRGVNKPTVPYLHLSLHAIDLIIGGASPEPHHACGLHSKEVVPSCSPTLRLPMDDDDGLLSPTLDRNSKSLYMDSTFRFFFIKLVDGGDPWEKSPRGRGPPWGQPCREAFVSAERLLGSIVNTTIRIYDQYMPLLGLLTWTNFFLG